MRTRVLPGATTQLTLLRLAQVIAASAITSGIRRAYGNSSRTYLREPVLVRVWSRRAGGVDVCELPYFAGEGDQVVRGV